MNDIHDAHASEIVREALFPLHRSPAVTSEANLRPMTAEDARKDAVSVLLNSKSMVPILQEISQAVRDGRMNASVEHLEPDHFVALHSMGYKTFPLCPVGSGWSISW